MQRLGIRTRMIMSFFSFPFELCCDNTVATLDLNQLITKLHNCWIVAHMVSLIYICVFCLLPFWCTKTRTSPQWVSDDDDCTLRLFTPGINICLVDLITKGLQMRQFTPGNNKHLHVSLNYFPCPLYKQVKRQGAYLGSLPDITLQKALAWSNSCARTRAHTHATFYENLNHGQSLQ